MVGAYTPRRYTPGAADTGQGPPDYYGTHLDRPTRSVGPVQESSRGTSTPVGAYMPDRPAPAPAAPAPAPAPVPAPAAAPAAEPGPAVQALQRIAQPPIDAGAGWETASTPGAIAPGLGERLSSNKRPVFAGRIY